MAAFHDEFEALNKAFSFSGLGVDENALISILGKLNVEERQTFRKSSSEIFIEDERQFDKWDDHHVLLLRHEFLRFKDAIVLWTMHPWERDARLLKESLHKGSQYFNVLIEIGCTRSSQQLLGARKAYHSLFHHSVEEDISFHVHTSEKKLLVAVLSSYRYEGPKVNEGIAKSEANIFFKAITKIKEKRDFNVKIIEEDEIVRILSTRSKLHLKAVYKHYKEISGNYLDEDLYLDLDDGDLLVKETVQCLCTPQAYFSEVLDASLGHNADERSKEGLSRVIITRADADMQQIQEEYNEKYGVTLSNKIQDGANGNYRDFLLTLLAKGE